MIIMDDDLGGISDLKQLLTQYFEIKDIGPLSYFFNIEVPFSLDGYYLFRVKYAFNLIFKAI